MWIPAHLRSQVRSLWNKCKRSLCCLNCVRCCFFNLHIICDAMPAHREFFMQSQARSLVLSVFHSRWVLFLACCCWELVARRGRVNIWVEMTRKKISNSQDWRLKFQKFSSCAAGARPSKKFSSKPSHEFWESPQNPAAATEISESFHTCRDLLVPITEELNPHWAWM